MAVRTNPGEYEKTCIPNSLVASASEADACDSAAFDAPYAE